MSQLIGIVCSLSRVARAVISTTSYYLYPLQAEKANREREALTSTADVKKAAASIVCATIAKRSGLKSSIQTWLVNSPLEIIVVTDESNYDSLKSDLQSLNCQLLRVICAPKRNKRVQLCTGFRVCQGDVIVITDDDTVWSPNVLQALTSGFSRDSQLGAVFPEVKFHPSNDMFFTVWETLSGARLFGDCIDIRTSTMIDGGVFCASGTTAAYRASILQDERCLECFPNERFMGALLNAGDDQSLNFWLCRNGWNVSIAQDNETSGCRVLTLARPDWTHLLQLVRWSRSDWLTYIRATFIDRTIWRYALTIIFRSDISSVC